MEKRDLGGKAGGFGPRLQKTDVALLCLGAEYPSPPSPKKLNLSIMVGLYKPKKVKGYLLGY